MENKNKKLIIAITGASGAIYGIRLLEILRDLGVQIHLIMSKSSHLTINTETNYKIEDIKKLADVVYSPSDIGARISSGSFITDGMIISPCSMKTLASIASGFDTDLISRAASVIMKEQRKLVLMVRETPLSAIHLENMLKLSRLGVSIAPPVPAFYNNPKNLEELINHTVCRILDLFNIETNNIKRWNGI